MNTLFHSLSSQVRERMAVGGRGLSQHDFMGRTSTLMRYMIDTDVVVMVLIKHLKVVNLPRAAEPRASHGLGRNDFVQP